MPKQRNRSRRLMGALLAALSLISLSACWAAPPAVVNVAEVTEAAESAEGIASARVETIGSLSGPNLKSSTIVDLVISDRYEVANADAMLLWGMKLAWSVNEARPNVSIRFGLVHEDGSPVDWAWRDAVIALGLDADRIGDDYPDKGQLSFLANLDDLEVLLGPWPGEVPKLPAGVLVAG